MFGVICLIFAAVASWHQIENHDYIFTSLGLVIGTIKDWSGTLALWACGWIGIHARDHKTK